MPPSSIRTTALALFAVLAVAACTRTGDAEPPTLHVYEVPPARTEALGMALNDVFHSGEGIAPVGKASSRVPGQLLVLAPDALHASIEDTLGQLLSGTDKRAATAGNVQLRFWLIDAVAGPTGSDASSVPQPVAASLQRQFAGQTFQLYDQARLGIHGLQGNASLNTNIGTEIRASVGEDGNDLLAELHIFTESAAGESLLQTRVALPMDEYVVLAVTGAPGGNMSVPRRIVVVQATSG